jgi:hypothetical protein
MPVKTRSSRQTSLYSALPQKTGRSLDEWLRLVKKSGPPREKERRGKLIDTGGYAKKDRITHRIPLASLADIDAEAKRWLKTAYDLQ